MISSSDSVDISFNTFALTPYQQPLYLSWQFAPLSSADNQSLVFKLSAKPDIKKLQYSIRAFINKHPLTQMLYDPISHQFIPGNFKIDEYLSINQQSTLSIKDVLNFPFDLHKSPLVKFYLLERSSQWYFIICSHHIICDGISARTMITDLAHLYIQAESQAPKSSQTIDYQAAVVACHKKSQSQAKQSQKYWQHYLSNHNLVTSFDKIYIKDQIESNAYVDFQLGQSELQKLGRQYQTTIFLLLAASYGYILARHTQSQTMLMSYPFNTRTPSNAKVIGCFVNSLPLKIDLNHIKTFMQLINQLNKDRKNSKLYRHHPIKSSNVINVGISQTNLNTTPFQLGHINAIELDYCSSDAHPYDLLLLFDQHSTKQVKCRYQFNPKVLDNQYVNDLIGQLKQLLKKLLTENISLLDYNLLQLPQYNQIVYSFNRPLEIAHQKDNIYTLFLNQVENTPKHVALLDNHQQLCYHSLHKQISCLTTALIKYPQQPIAIFLEKGIQFQMAFWGVLSVNAIYLPLNVCNSPKLTAYMLSKANCKTIITNKQLAPKISSLDNIDILLIDELLTHQPQGGTVTIATESLAYILFTSGTTSMPKGVAVSHTALFNRIQWMQKTFAINASDVVLQKTTPTFDVSLWEMIWPLCYGAKLASLPSHHTTDFNQLYQSIEHHQVTIIHFVPSVLDAFLQFLHVHQMQFPQTVRLLICSGEALSNTIVDKCYQLATHKYFRLYNLYGPTEACIDVSYEHCRVNTNVTIGTPIDNTQLYVLDHKQRILPIGIRGELYIGGLGLAEGYINDNELTQQVFVQHPFRNNQRLYRSGDLAAWQADGRLRYLGRADSEIKIHGQRVNLHQVEQAISQLPEIESCCVLNHQSNLIAFYRLTNAKKPLDFTAIHNELNDKLTDYMQPKQWQLIVTWPTNDSGKLDKKQLLSNLTAKLSSKSVAAANTATEIKLATIWQTTLKLSIIDIDARIDELHADSLQIISLLSKINKIFLLDLTAFDVIKLQTIRNIAQAIDLNQLPAQLIKPLAGQSHNPKLVFIHPAKGGCEVYQQLANQLQDNFYCLGLDNYNLYCDESACQSDLTKLAELYLKQVQVSIPNTNEAIVLCGWSLGGIIALALAYQLEQVGYDNLQVMLLDSYLADPYIKHKRQEIHASANYLQNLTQQSVEAKWQKRLAKLYPIECELENQMPNGKLSATRVILFKAQQLIPSVCENANYHALNQYIIDMPLNNIDLCVEKSKIHCIKLNCHHDNVIDTLLMMACFKLLTGLLQGINSSCKHV